MYSLLLALIYVAFISLGLPDSLLGSGWPAMHGDLNVPVSYMGIVSMVISGGTIVSSLFAEKLTRKFGTSVVTVISVFLTAAALFGFSFANKFWMLIAFAVPYGLGAGAVDASLNNYVALHYKSKHMSWLHCFWGVGTIVSPFIMSYALTKSVWNNGYRIVGFIQLGIALLLLFTLPVWKVNKRIDLAEQKSIGLAAALKMKGVPFLLIGFFAYCAAESTAMGWAATYFAEVKSVSAEQAAQLASLFYIGITASRFICGFVSDKLGDRKMIVAGTGILAGGIVLLMLPAPTAVAVVGFVVIGFGCGPIYPCIIHSTPALFGAWASQAVIGLEMACAYVGTCLMPPFFGWLAEHLFSTGLFPYYLALFLILMLLCSEHLWRGAAGRSPSDVQGASDKFL